ncbi:MAG: 2-hydroxyacid dehydrogenase [Chloroflexi bacterium]|jgi:D-lactate dehydrogenase|uniref:Hydroxyacid dehydrogenase n=1 Tax=Candidatus Thermofonsia Clade 3 bacterium TaxID=2364212 RepID=A0A2M8QEK6_9CHLR|nr:2-hydroxyacid dehydrogenase [Candidatus Roseilinea sp. NK_OTU-006]PJF48234.1 MAG: hydroxyacid dehydrogenase [Candidatus Thermofonsia Clade 3 bacterium]RMG64988.1 MAG: 2-hydroxyacid dehydrogenase [Chloroflexota bacterium]
MKAIIFDAKKYDRETLQAANQASGAPHELIFVESQLNAQTAALADGFRAISIFVNDDASAPVLERLARGGVRLLALRSTGFNHVDLNAAARCGITVMRVAHYSPYAVAEFAVGLLLAVNRKIHRAYNRIREGNFLLDGLQGRDIHGRTVGVIGTGRIGAVFARIMAGFGVTLLGYDVAPNPECIQLGMRYCPLDELLTQSDVVSLHAPLLPETYHLINAEALAKMKPGVILINTSRGALVDAEALIEALKSGHVGAVGLDVYEEEDNLFFRDRSDQIITDDVFARLMTFPNVLITGHQAFFTHEALAQIAETTIRNLSDFEAGCANENVLLPR